MHARGLHRYARQHRRRANLPGDPCYYAAPTGAATTASAPTAAPTTAAASATPGATTSGPARRARRPVAARDRGTAGCWPPLDLPSWSWGPVSSSSPGDAAAAGQCETRAALAEVARVEQAEFSRVGGDQPEFVVRQRAPGRGVAELDEAERRVLVGDLNPEAVRDVTEPGLPPVLAGEHDPAPARVPVGRPRAERRLVVEFVVLRGP